MPRLGERLDVELLLPFLLDEREFHLGQVQQLVADPQLAPEQAYADRSYGSELKRLIEIPG